MQPGWNLEKPISSTRREVVSLTLSRKGDKWTAGDMILYRRPERATVRVAVARGQQIVALLGSCRLGSCQRAWISKTSFLACNEDAMPFPAMTPSPVRLLWSICESLVPSSSLHPSRPVSSLFYEAWKLVYLAERGASRCQTNIVSLHAMKAWCRAEIKAFKDSGKPGGRQ